MIYGTNIRKNEFKGKCIVAFVDFLGFSHEIKTKLNDANNTKTICFERNTKFEVNRLDRINKLIELTEL